MSTLLIALSNLHFLRPGWLLALLLLPLLAWRWQRRGGERSGWQLAVDPHLLPHLLETPGHERRRTWAAWFGLTGLLLLMLALAGPSLRKDELPLWQNRQPLVIAMDLSRAMLTRDLPPNRLLQARAKLARLLQQRGGGQTALLAYADDAFTVAPLTADPDNVAIFLDALDPTVMPADGQHADRAIAHARQLLQQAGFSGGEILLLTDHADAAAIASAAQARAAGIRVSVLGLGTVQGGVHEADGGLRQARLDAPSLRALAGSGGGRYQTLTTDDADLRALGLSDSSAQPSGDGKSGTVARWRDDGYWLLPLAMLCLLPLFRRGGALLLLACVLWQPLWSVQAQVREEDRPRATLWRRADQVAHAQMQQGIEAYRHKAYAKAIEHFAPLTDAEGQYNLGNALAQSGRYDEAIAAYDRALRQQPEMADAQHNRRLVEDARKRQQQQRQAEPSPSQEPASQSREHQQPPPQSDGQGQGQGRGQQTRKQPGQQAREQQKSMQAAPPVVPEQSSKAASAQAARKQAQADAAQRERMQEAMRQRHDGDAEAASEAGKPQETAAQRERRLANQAWLQRVPDDPGALLRARFRLEAQRRREGLP